MFDQKYFEYNESEHKGFYKGELVPSVTQLVDIVYPMGKDIPQDRLESASKRGTLLHSDIDFINMQFDDLLENHNSFKETINKVLKYAIASGNQDLIDYVSYLSAYQLLPFRHEQLVFLLDENKDLICYGHYDCIYLALENIEINGNLVLESGNLYMFDYKKISLFNDKKVGMQESIYSCAFEQSDLYKIKNMFALWFSPSGTKMMPLKRQETNYTIQLCKELRKVWIKN